MVAKELDLSVRLLEGEQYEALNGQSLAVLGKCTAQYKISDTNGQARGYIDDITVGRIYGYDVVLG